MRWKEPVSTNLTDHHIEGYARAAVEQGLDGHFSVDLITHVEGNLWQGGCINGVVLPDDFGQVISLYPWEKYALGPNTLRTEITMYDAGDMPDIQQLHEIAEMVVRSINDGNKTLVHCQAGLNRSGLVAGLALIKMGRTPEEAIKLLRDSRCPMVLCNKTFETWLLNEAS